VEDLHTVTVRHKVVVLCVSQHEWHVCGFRGLQRGDLIAVEIRLFLNLPLDPPDCDRPDD
jgi:hypothetical protein